MFVLQNVEHKQLKIEQTTFHGIKILKLAKFKKIVRSYGFSVELAMIFRLSVLYSMLIFPYFWKDKFRLLNALNLQRFEPDAKQLLQLPAMTIFVTGDNSIKRVSIPQRISVSK